MSASAVTVVGLIGMIGSGKTTVARRLGEHGATVIMAKEGGGLRLHVAPGPKVVYQSVTSQAACLGKAVDAFLDDTQHAAVPGESD